jgi:hypothetical protein
VPVAAVTAQTSLKVREKFVSAAFFDKRRISLHRRRFLLATLLIALMLSVVSMAPRHRATAQGAASAKAQKTASSNATATVHDFDASATTLLLLRSDDYNGVSQASYTASSSHSSSLINRIGDEWNLNLTQQSLRTVYILPTTPSTIFSH